VPSVQKSLLKTERIRILLIVEYWNTDKMIVVYKSQNRCVSHRNTICLGWVEVTDLTR